MPKIGIYSEKAAELSGSVFWSTPDNRVVEVTGVGDSSVYPDGYQWPDKVIVGEVTEYVRQGRSPRAPRFERRE